MLVRRPVGTVLDRILRPSHHTLTLRPLVVSDSSTIRLSHNDDRMVCTLGADSYVTTLSGRWSVEISRADYQISLVRLENQNFYTAIRNKLMWGR